MSDKNQFLFTSNNLIENIDKLGAWSAYGLASSALRHYFPDEYKDDEEPTTAREGEMLHELGLQYWHDIIIKYQTEVGYDAPDGFNQDYVNEF